jgi:hypothetical protein
MKNYFDNPTQYAFDLTEAARSEDWERYKNIQAQLSAETTLRVLDSAKAAERGKQAAIAEVAKSNPGFDGFHNSPAYKDVLADHPTLAEAISTAEDNPAYQTDYLPDLYLMALDCAVGKGAQPQAQPQRPQFQPLRSELTPSAFTEETFFEATQLSKKADLSSDKRKALIAALEARGILDTQF